MKREDLIYGQNWVEQTRQARRDLHFCPIHDSSYEHAHVLLLEMARMLEIRHMIIRSVLFRGRGHSLRVSQDYTMIR